MRRVAFFETKKRERGKKITMMLRSSLSSSPCQTRSIQFQRERKRKHERGERERKQISKLPVSGEKNA